MQPDKRAHFVVGFLIAAIVGLVNPFLGFGAAALAGLAKELYDATGRGTPELMDFVYTVAGGALGASLVALLQI